VPIATTVIFLIASQPWFNPFLRALPWRERSDRPDAGWRIGLSGHGRWPGTRSSLDVRTNQLVRMTLLGMFAW